jgi:hypothetical protein
MRTTITVVLTALLAIACDDSAVGPTSGTRVEAVVQDSPSGTSAVTGSLAGNVSASAWNGDRWYDLGSSNGITIPLQVSGRSTTVHGETSIPSASYNRVRLLLQGVSARVNRGSVIGGTALANDTTIALGGSDQRAELIVPVDAFAVAVDSSKRTIVFELRSSQWLTSGALQSGIVEDASLQTAVTAATRVESR